MGEKTLVLFFRSYPVRFQRQKTIGSYIADFYCAKAGLVIELDGSGHFYPKAEEKDKIRKEKIEENGFMVIRFCNLDIEKIFTVFAL